MLNSNRNAGKRLGVLVSCLLCAVCLTVSAFAAGSSAGPTDNGVPLSAFPEGSIVTTDGCEIDHATAIEDIPTDYAAYIEQIESGALQPLTGALTDGAEVGMTGGDGCPDIDLARATVWVLG